MALSRRIMHDIEPFRDEVYYQQAAADIRRLS
jgi:hypothetical protein